MCAQNIFVEPSRQRVTRFFYDVYNITNSDGWDFKNTFRFGDQVIIEYQGIEIDGTDANSDLLNFYIPKEIHNRCNFSWCLYQEAIFD